MKKNIDWAQIINWILTIVLIVAVLFAVNQRYFEDRKCNDWVKDKVVEFQMQNGGFYMLNLSCVVDTVNPVQQNKLADKSANLEILQ